IRDFHVTGVQTCALPISSELDIARASDHVQTRIECTMLAEKRFTRQQLATHVEMPCKPFSLIIVKQPDTRVQALEAGLAGFRAGQCRFKEYVLGNMKRE